MRSLLTNAADSVLLLVDIQERLTAAMLPEERERVLRGAGMLAEAAARLGVPRIVTEQYPKGLGPTEGCLRERLDDTALRFEKTTFSCCGADGLGGALDNTGRSQVVMAGMESHVCVLQTALDLMAAGKRVIPMMRRQFGPIAVVERAAKQNPAIGRFVDLGMHLRPRRLPFLRRHDLVHIDHLHQFPLVGQPAIEETPRIAADVVAVVADADVDRPIAGDANVPPA